MGVKTKRAARPGIENRERDAVVPATGPSTTLSASHISFKFFFITSIQNPMLEHIRTTRVRAYYSPDPGLNLILSIFPCKTHRILILSKVTSFSILLSQAQFNYTDTFPFSLSLTPIHRTLEILSKALNYDYKLFFFLALLTPYRTRTDYLEYFVITPSL